MEKPWKGEYAVKSADRDIGRARNGYGPEPYEADKSEPGGSLFIPEDTLSIPFLMKAFKLPRK